MNREKQEEKKRLLKSKAMDKCGGDRRATSKEGRDSTRKRRAFSNNRDSKKFPHTHAAEQVKRCAKETHTVQTEWCRTTPHPGEVKRLRALFGLNITPCKRPNRSRRTAEMTEDNDDNMALLRKSNSSCPNLLKHLCRSRERTERTQRSTPRERKKKSETTEEKRWKGTLKTGPL